MAINITLTQSGCGTLSILVRNLPEHISARCRQRCYAVGWKY